MYPHMFLGTHFKRPLPFPNKMPLKFFSNKKPEGTAAFLDCKILTVMSFSDAHRYNAEFKIDCCRNLNDVERYIKSVQCRIPY